MRLASQVVPCRLVQVSIPGEPSGSDEKDVPNFDLDSLSSKRLHEIFDLDCSRRTWIDRATYRLPPPRHVSQHGPPDNASSGPMFDAVVCVIYTVVVAIHRAAYMAKAVPLTRALRVPPHELVVVTDLVVVNHMLERRTREKRRPGEPDFEVEVDPCPLDKRGQARHD